MRRPVTPFPIHCWLLLGPASSRPSTGGHSCSKFINASFVMPGRWHSAAFLPAHQTSPSPAGFPKPEKRWCKCLVQLQASSRHLLLAPGEAWSLYSHRCSLQRSLLWRLRIHLSRAIDRYLEGSFDTVSIQLNNRSRFLARAYNFPSQVFLTRFTIPGVNSLEQALNLSREWLVTPLTVVPLLQN